MMHVIVGMNCTCIEESMRRMVEIQVGKAGCKGTAGMKTHKRVQVILTVCTVSKDAEE